MQKYAEAMKERTEVIKYLESVFRKERPNRSITVFRAKIRTIPTDELYRISDAIRRFGLDNLI